MTHSRHVGTLSLSFVRRGPFLLRWCRVDRLEEEVCGRVQKDTKQSETLTTFTSLRIPLTTLDGSGTPDVEKRPPVFKGGLTGVGVQFYPRFLVEVGIRVPPLHTSSCPKVDVGRKVSSIPPSLKCRGGRTLPFRTRPGTVDLPWGSPLFLFSFSLIENSWSSFRVRHRRGWGTYGRDWTR